MSAADVELDEGGATLKVTCTLGIIGGDWRMNIPEVICLAGWDKYAVRDVFYLKDTWRISHISTHLKISIKGLHTLFA